MKKKILLTLVTFVMILSYITFIPSAVRAEVTSNEGIRYMSKKESAAYDIKEVVNGDTMICTTYNDRGYKVYFKVGDTEESFKNILNGGSITVNGLELKITGYEDIGDVYYEVTNNDSTSKSFNIATTADIQLGSNDLAAVYKDGHSSIKITQDDPLRSTDYKAQLEVSFIPQAKTTWIGSQRLLEDNKYVDGTKTSYTFADHVDTGMTFSWEGEVGAGETKRYIARFGYNAASRATVRFNGVPTLQQVLVGGTVTTPTLDDEEGYKDRKWNTKSDGSGTSYDGGAVVIVTESIMDFYEIKTPYTYTINLNNQDTTTPGTSKIYEVFNTKFSLTENGEAMTSTENNIEIPTKTGYIFDGYYTSLDENGVKFIDGNGYITDDANTSNFLSNGTLYAKWKYDYKIIDGGDQIHEEKDGKDISVKTNGDSAKFIELQVDGEKVSDDNYTVQPDGTFVLKSEYLDTLSDGTHKLTIVYSDGEVSTYFKVIKTSNEDTTNNPKTGDNNIMLISILALASVTAVSTFKFHKIK